MEVRWSVQSFREAFIYSARRLGLNFSTHVQWKG